MYVQVRVSAIETHPFGDRLKLKYQDTLNAIYAQLDRLGDLPVFSATVNRIRQVSSSRQSDAMALAMAVMKDANLSTKLLKIANTPSYNRSGGQISAVSRAVVLIGFERIHNLCVTLKLIESFRDEQPDTGVEQLLISAFLNASLARELAAAAGALDIEEAYICGLLYGLGEIIVAFTLPDTYNEMLRLRERGRERWPRIQLQQLGGHFSDIGQDLAQSWGFPKSVVQAMDPMTADQLRGGGRLNHRLAAGCHDLLELLYGRDTSGELEYATLMNDLADVIGQQPGALDRQI
ncbi:MAG: HDOD domain-containing protein, partial [Clostridia bacterium]|nr:HDOD domain-containing protein [Clostridia bacterium]